MKHKKTPIRFGELLNEVESVKGFPTAMIFKSGFADWQQNRLWNVEEKDGGNRATWLHNAKLICRASGEVYYLSWGA